ncbi:helix-turn-helix domain-containing protein [Wenzhouxiangella sp. EGI_FJ10409]|uniref:helix-turn-helix domain-containing protein n=1 Tax=Wenzhouxiangella sp. EGI_FJ10409 TaxID=3243767 RepID=UPI0035DB5601
MSEKQPDQGPCLHEFVRCVVRQYLDDMGHTPPENLHGLIMSEAERALVETVLGQTDGNQSRAAEILGITRTTLRNRIRRYGLD